MEMSSSEMPPLILRYSFFSISEMPTLVSGTMLEKGCQHAISWLVLPSTTTILKHILSIQISSTLRCCRCILHFFLQPPCLCHLAFLLRRRLFEVVAPRLIPVDWNLPRNIHPNSSELFEFITIHLEFLSQGTE